MFFCMKRKDLVILFMSIQLLASCNHKSVDFESDHSIVLTTEDNPDYISCIESIEVLDFTVDEDWVHMSYPRTYITDNLCVFLNKQTYQLLCYDNYGEKLFSRNIRGRGYGECMNVGNIYARNDSVFVYDQVYSCINVYNLEGKTIGVISTNDIFADEVFPIHGGYMAVSMEGISRKDRYYVAVYDSLFNLKNKFLKIPKYLYGWNQHSGHKSLVSIYNDTLKFMLPLDYNYYSVQGANFNSIYQFQTENPIQLKDLDIREDAMTIMMQIVTSGYASVFERLCETKRYVSFRYSVNDCLHSVLIDKTNNKLYNLSNPMLIDTGNVVPKIEEIELWKHVVHSATSLYSDETYIYSSVGYSLYRTLNAYRNQLEGKLFDFYEQMNRFISDNNLDENDRVLVKIRMKE